MKTVLLLAILGVLAAQVACKVKGVAPDRASLYDEKKSHFTCLDGSSKIPFDQVNDDYCDCRDGSDEPGTAACINSQFACENLGYVVQYIPSSRVNDGICDCCDGSDEYDGKAQCQNTCDELAAKLREEQEKTRKLKEEGFLKRQELIQLGAELKKTIQEKLSELETKKATLLEDKTKHEASKIELEKVANEAKEKEDKILAELAAEQRKKEMDAAARELFKLLDVDKDSFLSADELTVHQELDILFDNDGTFTIQESLQLLDDNHKMDIELFATSYYEKISPHLNKKQSESSGEGQQVTQSESEQQDHSDQVNDYETGEGSDGEHDHEHGDDHGHDIQYEGSSTSSPSTGDNSKYQESTQKLIDDAEEAKRQLQETEQSIRNVDSEISEAKKKLEMDLGPNGEFASMIDHCFEYEDREYVYKLCPFEKTVQKSKNNHVETSIGHWKSWNEEGGNKYASMKFENGLACWNGPQRSTKVLLTCGLENKLTAVSEPNRCEYEMKFETPALCESHVDQHSHAHEDL